MRELPGNEKSLLTTPVAAVISFWAHRDISVGRRQTSKPSSFAEKPEFRSDERLAAASALASALH
jgi:hypothetical protein